jgi:hypothetical protein
MGEVGVGALAPGKWQEKRNWVFDSTEKAWVEGQAVREGGISAEPPLEVLQAGLHLQNSSSVSTLRSLHRCHFFR